ncbi:MAG: thiamine-phosphate kinase [Gemmatimonadota bacterium]|nr:thiamine-phosphate kinase [Gemmatimonadota bacterium]
MTDDRHLAMGGGAEFDLIRRLLATWGDRASGIGDDAAVIAVPPGEKLVASTDASVEHVHFRREWMTAREVGARAATAALSDLAAMGARPLGLLLAIALPDTWLPDAEALADGVGGAASAVGCPIVGGNVTRSSELALTITVLGSAVAPLTRSGAREGDVIFVTGQLGGPGAALAALLGDKIPDAAHRERFVAPVARIAAGRWVAACGASAAIDISDGLLADAAHLARASGISLSLDADAVPRLGGVSQETAMRSGEEYELLVAIPPHVSIDTEMFERTFGIPLTAVGVSIARTPHPVRTHVTGTLPSGHDHLSR